MCLGFTFTWQSSNQKDRRNMDTHCENCGKELEDVVSARNGHEMRWKRKVCYNCNPFPSGSLEYRGRVESIMKHFPDRIKVLSSCSCEGRKKVRHHPNYDKPLEVELLCYPCHSRTHLPAKDFIK